MKTWIDFRTKMPSLQDADKNMEIELKEINGRIRKGLWDWVNSAEHWECNGFVQWRSISA